MQKHSTILIQQLALNNIDLEVVHSGGNGYSKSKFVEQFGTNHIQETLIEFPNKGNLPGHYIRENRIYSQSIYKKFESTLSQFDLIYAQGFTGSYFIKTKKRNNHNVPVVVNLHGLEMFQFAADFKVKLQYLLLKREAKFILRNADWVYSFGGKLNEILDRLGVEPKRILDQSNGIQNDWLVDNPVFHIERTFLFIGRNERRKGIIELHQALKKMIENPNLNFRFNFVGEIDEQTKIIDSRITYFGEIRDQKVIRDIIDQSDILVCPSFAEGMPTVILEAMARGLAIIVTDVGAVNKLVNKNGILLNSPVVDDLTKAILEMIALPANELELLKEKSIQLIREKFVWSKIVESKISDFKRISKK